MAGRSPMSPLTEPHIRFLLNSLWRKSSAAIDNKPGEFSRCEELAVATIRHQFSYREEGNLCITIEISNMFLATLKDASLSCFHRLCPHNGSRLV